jgi:hypothetical protein
MSTYTQPVARAVPGALRQAIWFTLVCCVAFLVPYVGVSRNGPPAGTRPT